MRCYYMTDYERKLMAEYRRLAKRADQRLVRLEKYEKEKGFESITQYAYRVAMKDISTYTGKGTTKGRFNTKPPMKTNKRTGEKSLNVTRLEDKIADIKKFLQSPSSTKKGVLDIYKKRADSLNKSSIFGDQQADFTWQEWANFWEKVGNKYYDENVDYNTGAKVLYLEKKHKLNQNTLKKLRDVDFEKVDFDNEKEVKKVFGQKLSELYRSGEVDEIELETMKNLEKNGLSYKDLK